ncbi:hypothetical protein [Methylopila sp. M107]|uniref:hypothetical protein n=1 Tax=Methylopila sp. M107 TaxID=1101190 RepID=UPI00037D6026|nr:hypothetical protein [Methylopila sp. M107]
MTPPAAPAAFAPSATAGRFTRLAGAFCLAGAMAACSQTGDFGRKNPNVVNDSVLPAVGTALAYTRAEPVSPFRGTDNEETMRDRAWAVVMPPLEAQLRGRILAELMRTRVLPTGAIRLEKENYVQTLLSVDYRSSAARYDQLLDNVVEDTARIEPFFASAHRVDVDDRARRRTLDRAPEVTPDERAAALARIEENGVMIAWTRASFEDRLIAYRYALDRLMIETPDPKADEVAAAIAAFEMVLRSLRPLGPQRGVFKS